jgi:hypothetical protein
MDHSASGIFWSNSLSISIICWTTSKADCTSNSPINKVFVAKAIKKLNSNKSSDEFGLAAEHLKYGVEVICPALTKVFNEILASSKSPVLQFQ